MGRRIQLIGGPCDGMKRPAPDDAGTTLAFLMPDCKGFAEYREGDGVADTGERRWLYTGRVVKSGNH